MLATLINSPRAQQLKINNCLNTAMFQLSLSHLCKSRCWPGLQFISRLDLGRNPLSSSLPWLLAGHLLCLLLAGRHQSFAVWSSLQDSSQYSCLQRKGVVGEQARQCPSFLVTQCQKQYHITSVYSVHQKVVTRPSP